MELSSKISIVRLKLFELSQITIKYHPRIDSNWYQTICSVQRSRSHICGCILIQRNWALTAAHCFPDIQFNISDYSVVVGKNDLHSVREVDHELLSRIVIHGAFK